MGRISAMVTGIAPGRRLTRIVATLGPSTAAPRQIGALVEAGIDVARINFSHGTPESHAELATAVRRSARQARRPVGILCDLEGPKVRLGDFPAPLPVRVGDLVTLANGRIKAQPDRGILPVDYPHLVQEALPGHRILLADGLVELQVEEVAGGRVVARVLEGEQIPPRTGLALPQAEVHGSSFTPRDRRALARAVAMGADFIALSYVRRPEDIKEARRALERLHGDQLLIAKIETAAALTRLDEILAAADAVMVARGDLGVELPPERVPVEQKRILTAATAAGKPSIVATQMLESMRTAARPTRAEAADVANAVLDGSWALMLAAETAVGSRPAEAVAMLGRIAREAERLLLKTQRRRPFGALAGVSEGLAEAAAYLALQVGAKAVVALTRSGATGCQVARRPTGLPTFAFTPSPRTLQRLTLFRGIRPRWLASQPTLERAVSKVESQLLREKVVSRGDLLVLLGGSPDEPLGVTNQLRVHLVR